MNSAIHQRTIEATALQALTTLSVLRAKYEAIRDGRNPTALCNLHDEANELIDGLKDTNGNGWESPLRLRDLEEQAKDEAAEYLRGLNNVVYPDFASIAADIALGHAALLIGVK